MTTTTPDLVRAVRDHLANSLDGVRVVTRLPDGPRFEEQLEQGPVVLLTRGVGGGYVKGERRVMFDVDVLAPFTEEEALWEVTDRAWRALDAPSVAGERDKKHLFKRTGCSFRLFRVEDDIPGISPRALRLCAPIALPACL